MKKLLLAFIAMTAMVFATNPHHEHECQVGCMDGIDGVNGLSAYEIAQNNGFEGSATQWLESLQGADGIDGVNTYEVIYRTDSKSVLALADEMQTQVDNIMNAYDDLAEQGLNLSAGANAMAAIDFNADHKGHSVGFGYGFGNTWKGYRGGAGALGYQYAWTVDERDVSFVIKSWAGKQSTYGVGFGGVIGF